MTGEQEKHITEQAAVVRPATPARADPLRLLAFALFAIAAAVVFHAFSSRYELQLDPHVNGIAWRIDRLTGTTWMGGLGHWTELRE